MSQERTSKSTERREEEAVAEVTPEQQRALGEQAARSTELVDDIDNILNEVDGVLEANAEEFVAGFRQKGGQ